MMASAATKKDGKRSRPQEMDSGAMMESLERLAKVRTQKALREGKLQRNRIMKLDNCKKTIAARQRFHNRQKQKILRVANLRIATAAKSRAGFEDQMLALCKLWCDSVRTVEDVVMTGYDSRDEELSALTAGEPQDVEMANAADDEDDSEDSLMADVGDEMAVDAVNNTTTDVEMVI